MQGNERTTKALRKKIQPRRPILLQGNGYDPHVALCVVCVTGLHSTGPFRYVFSMAETSSLPLPVTRALSQLGHDLALARRRRGISTADMAERLFIGRRTLWRLAKGDPTVSLGAFASAAFVLHFHERLAQLAAPAQDTLAFELDEERLPKRNQRRKA